MLPKDTRKEGVMAKKDEPKVPAVSPTGKKIKPAKKKSKGK